METIVPGVGYAGVPALNRYDRSTINVNKEKTRACIIFPTTISRLIYDELVNRFKLIVDAHNGIPLELLAKLFGTSESLTQFDAELMELSLSIEEMVEKTLKPAGFPYWNADILVSQCLDNGMERDLLKLLKTIFPLACEDYLLAGLFSHCIERIGECYNDSGAPGVDVMIEWKNVHLLQSVKHILTVRRDLLKAKDIPEMLHRLDVEFTWLGVKAVRNFLSKYPSSVIALDKIWDVLEALDSYAPGQKTKIVGFIVG
jgi:hypothetical protein